MKHLVVLTTTEAKKFIAKSLIQRHDSFKVALEKGIIVLHPSTSTVFIYEEITGKKPEGLWFCGAVTSKGTCISKEFEEVAANRKQGFDQHDVTYSWAFKKGTVFKDEPLGNLLKEMGQGDYYVKGVNVVDYNGHAGVLTANRDGGTITRAMVQARKRNFEIMLVATMNKVINVPIEEALKAAAPGSMDGAMGIPAGLFKANGTLLNEVKAFHLQGLKAVPIASGGLQEAEGASVFIIEGEKKDVEACLEVIDQCKSARLDVNFPDCKYCRYSKCPLATSNLLRSDR